MNLDYGVIDPATRDFAVSEVEADIEAGRIYISSRLSAEGRAAYPSLLADALRDGSDSDLQTALEYEGILNSHEERTTQSGTSKVRVPSNAAATLAEGEFNRFFLRGLCAQIVDSGGGQVEIYRARESVNPRSSSTQMMGTLVDAAQLLEDLRSHIGVDSALGLPPGPNSGLSGRIPARA